MNQWLTAAFTKTVPAVFKYEYTPHESWVESFKKNEDLYLKDEISYFVYIQPLYEKHSITIKDCFKEFKPGKIYEPFYFMSYLQQEVETDTPFDDEVFMAYLGIIYKNRYFPQLITKMKIADILYETESSYLAAIQKAALFSGGNPLIKTTNRAIPYPNPKDNVISMQILSGQRDEDFTRRMYTYNNTLTYASVDKTYYTLLSQNNPAKSDSKCNVEELLSSQHD